MAPGYGLKLISLLLQHSFCVYFCKMGNRKSPRPKLPVSDPLDRFTNKKEKHHLVQFYNDESYLLELLCLFVNEGLKSGDGVIVIATKSHLQAIENGLTELGPDFLSTALLQGQLYLIDADQMLIEILNNEKVDEARFMKSIGTLFQKMKHDYSKVRSYGEIVNLLWSRENLDEAIALEKLWNNLAKIHSFRLLCVYILDSFKKETNGIVFDQICLQHSHVIPAEDFILLENEESQRRLVAKLQQKAKELDFMKKIQMERLELVRRERAARAEADRANHAKDEFLAIISHELRSPLQPILSWVHLLQMGHLRPSDVKHGLEVIERSARNQMQIINDLLDVSRVISGKMELKMQRVDLSREIMATLESNKGTAERAGIKMTSEIENDIFIHGDPARLQQVLWNLLSNALKFTPQNGHIHLKLEKVGSHAELIVKDTGKGIPKSFLPHLFERFRQEDSSTTRLKGGLGLGLAIVRSLVERHGGSIRAESEGPGKGATFTISLPSLPKMPIIQKPPQRYTAHSLQSLPELSGVRILVVDDEADTKEAITAVLGTCHANVQSVSSAREALQVIQDQIPDLVLCDLGMPGEDGYSFISKLRNLDPSKGGNVKAIALTAFARESDLNEVFRAGFQAHIAKPVDIMTLTHTIANLLTIDTKPQDILKRKAA